jgi:hypothetical protein
MKTPTKKRPQRNYVSLSFSAHPSLEAPLNRRSMEMGISRSEFVCKLIERDLIASGLLDEAAWFAKMDAPPRVTRANGNGKATKKK